MTSLFVFGRKRSYFLYFLLILILIVIYFSSPSYASQDGKASNFSISMKDIIQITISIVTAGFGLITLWRGVNQYSKDQRWKKAEFVAKEMKEFRSDPAVSKVLLMLDWRQREIILLENSDPDKNISILFVDEEICGALQAETFENKKGGFSPQQVLIRDYFDIFFEYLEKFEAFIDAGLVDEKDFRPYLIYWLEIVGDKNNQKDRKTKKCLKRIWGYIDYFGYDKVRKFMSRYDCEIKQNDL